MLAAGWGALIWAGVAARAAGEESPAQAEVLRLAVQERRIVTFTYKGYTRAVEPHALGRAGDDKPALLAWQVSGGSSTEPPPGWRVFLVEEVTGLKATTKTFEKPRDDYHQGKSRGLKSVEVEVAAAVAP
ncbi:MAG: hypothetical protein K0R17_3038 [Rariglobus sp.]|jgi:hypothetical protein|nr:hypothetical protein [Rariglobus sp.]